MAAVSLDHPSSLSLARLPSFYPSPPEPYLKDVHKQQWKLILKQQASQSPRSYSEKSLLPNGTPNSAPATASVGTVPSASSGRVMQAGGTRILCVADVRGIYSSSPSRASTSNSSIGNLRSLNDLAKSAHADCIIHTGDFGFYDEHSLERIAEKWVCAQARFGFSQVAYILTDCLALGLSNTLPNTPRSFQKSSDVRSFSLHRTLPSKTEFHGMCCRSFRIS